MEKEWMNTIDHETKEFFRAKRFMDDILLVYAKNEKWDAEAFIGDFKRSECYWAPLKLEEGKARTFLETRFELSPDKKNISYRLKNDNEGRTEPQIWRYHHFQSYGSYIQKRATLLAALWKVHHMASDSKQLLFSGIEKLKEFEKLDYPKGIRKYMCGILARETDNYMWYAIMRAQT